MPENPFKILNCFGNVAGLIKARDTTHALTLYAIRVDTKLSELRQKGYKAVPNRNEMNKRDHTS